MKKNEMYGVERLIKQRDELVAQMEALKHKISGLEMAIRLFEESPETQPSASLQTIRISKTDAIRRLLKEAGAQGLVARDVLERSTALGVELKLGSVASVLSRMKREGEVVYGNGRYKLKEFEKDGRRFAAGTHVT